MQIKVDNEIFMASNDDDGDTNAGQKWKTVKTFEEFDPAEVWVKETYNAKVNGTSKTRVFQDSAAMVSMVTKSKHIVFSWKRYSCKKKPYSVKILFQHGKFSVQEQIVTQKRTNPIGAEETTGSLSSQADEIGVPSELHKTILFMYNNQCQPKNISDKLKNGDDDQLMELFQSEETVQVSTYNHFLLNCFYVTIFILLGH